MNNFTEKTCLTSFRFCFIGLVRHLSHLLHSVLSRKTPGEKRCHDVNIGPITTTSRTKLPCQPISKLTRDLTKPNSDWCWSTTSWTLRDVARTLFPSELPTCGANAIHSTRCDVFARETSACSSGALNSAIVTCTNYNSYNTNAFS